MHVSWLRPLESAALHARAPALTIRRCHTSGRHSRTPALTIRRCHTSGHPPPRRRREHMGARLPKRRRQHLSSPTPEIGRSPHPTSEAPDLAAGRYIGDRSAPLPAIGRLIGRKSGPDSTRRDFIGLRRALSDVKLAQVSCNSQKAPTPPPNPHRDL
jgi:hypothetical protein